MSCSRIAGASSFYLFRCLRLDSDLGCQSLCSFWICLCCWDFTHCRDLEILWHNIWFYRLLFWMINLIRPFVKSIIKNLELHYKKRELPGSYSNPNDKRWIQFNPPWVDWTMQFLGDIDSKVMHSFCSPEIFITIWFLYLFCCVNISRFIIYFQIQNMKHMIHNETLPLKEEKQLIRQIKLLKQNHGELFNIIAKQDQLQSLTTKKILNLKMA